MSEQTEKPYQGVVYCSNDGVIEDKNYETPQAARRAVYRGLFRSEPGSRGEVVYTKVPLPKSGGVMREAITRDIAVAEIMKGGRSPVTQRKVVGSTANTCRAKETRCSFSRG